MHTYSGAFFTAALILPHVQLQDLKAVKLGLTHACCILHLTVGRKNVFSKHMLVRKLIVLKPKYVVVHMCR